MGTTNSQDPQDTHRCAAHLRTTGAFRIQRRLHTAGVRVAVGHLRHTADDFLLFELLDPTSAHARTFKDNAALLRLIATRIEESTK